jgi:hypothetical protein
MLRTILGSNREEIIKEDEMGMICCLHGREEKRREEKRREEKRREEKTCIQGFGDKVGRKETTRKT